ncbi:hypothetical protein MPTK1_7g12770 [Marchantia polymorpha subsp. ruderalis]|uniref:Uncharacterized protein n=2 Tax=Marchantia polymorpha TaxID=3197 RepID=A0AAF6BYX1_MARPO|nr:hypothetical protein MARPO_0003s0285 [Marchantia polymorpha]BBN17205.1 hypothetical protein Mp_7g12770 [Marchantia polymorpha subsp. ruderalis]|eukprot:PTQ49440.1 hypothetical protein MARPO_0003s0285 [Marchantia polymorpha]
MWIIQRMTVDFGVKIACLSSGDSDALVSGALEFLRSGEHPIVSFLHGV